PLDRKIAVAVFELRRVVGEVGVQIDLAAQRFRLPLAAELGAVSFYAADVLIEGLRRRAAGNERREGLQAILETRAVDDDRRVEGRAVRSNPQLRILRAFCIRARRGGAGRGEDVIRAAR